MILMPANSVGLHRKEAPQAVCKGQWSDSQIFVINRYAAIAPRQLQLHRRFLTLIVVDADLAGDVGPLRPTANRRATRAPVMALGRRDTNKQFIGTHDDFEIHQN